MATSMTQCEPFVHLQIHSEYSLADSVIRIKELATTAAAQGMPAVALTDRGNLFALIKFYQACLGAGVQPIIGVEIRYRSTSEQVVRALLLAMNQMGYRNLLQLISRAFTDSDEHGLVPRADIMRLQEGLIMLSGGRHGEIGHALINGDTHLAEQLTAEWSNCFAGRFYLELQRTARPGDEMSVRAHVELAHRLQVPVVATNDVCFLVADDFEAHETRICIHQGRVLNDPRRDHNYSAQQYLKSAEQMQALFADIPEAITNTVEIARRCSVTLELKKYFLPNYPVPADETLASHLDRMASAGLANRLLRLPMLAGEEVRQKHALYQERLRF